jgi:uncharacterized membrane protein YeaQ/YmgE (transglycosylase-associated protein family)
VLILGIIVFGMAIGWVANMVLGGGGRPKDWGELLMAGLVGSFVGGLLGSLIFGDGLDLRPSGIIGSLVGAVLVLVVWRGIKGSRRQDVKK